MTDGMKIKGQEGMAPISCRDYGVRKINAEDAQAMSVRYHYLHRKCPCTIAYGLFEQQGEGRMVGCMIYGCPSSSTLKKGVCGDSEAEHVIELKRLWVEDNTPKNIESYFIAKTQKLMRKDKPTHDIIVSYADYGYGHIGLVYQATHWIYTGMSAAFKDYVMDGDDRDHLTQQDEWKHLYGSVKKAREVLGDKIVTMERSRKHRYVCFNGHCRARNRELRSKLNYEILPYPKNVTDEVVHIVNASTIKPLEEYQ